MSLSSFMSQLGDSKYFLKSKRSVIGKYWYHVVSVCIIIILHSMHFHYSYNNLDSIPCFIYFICMHSFLHFTAWYAYLWSQLYLWGIVQDICVTDISYCDLDFIKFSNVDRSHFTINPTSQSIQPELCDIWLFKNYDQFLIQSKQFCHQKRLIWIHTRSTLVFSRRMIFYIWDFTHTIYKTHFQS